MGLLEFTDIDTLLFTLNFFIVAQILRHFFEQFVLLNNLLGSKYVTAQ